ncbi:PAS domain S-box protein [Phenylobacterium sp.]|jgi:PAS domain S-box-containing protein|uniref:sensor histidine kinase n=1 Tax=Phenylobacterium sp. TaxID=1871053 RepID=UPI002F41BFEE
MPEIPIAPWGAHDGVEAAQALEELRQHLAAIVESSGDAILSKNLDGVITSWNRGAEQLFGYTAEEAVGQSVTLLIPADRLDEEPSILARLHRGERIDHFETVRRRKDGSLVDISLTVSPIRDSTGRVVGASKIARDVTDRRRVLEQQSLMLGEMQHRVKNLAAVIDGLARQSQPDDDPGVKAFVARFLGRVHALLSTGELVMSASDRHADLRQVVENVLQPFLDPSKASPITLDGPPLPLPEHTSGALALATHELATNALKYGALKVPKGRVSLTWSVEPGREADRVRIEWEERGGPKILSPPTRQGFGDRVVRSAVSREREGRTDVVFGPDGMLCRFEFLTAPKASAATTG